MSMKTKSTYIGGQNVSVKGHGRLWAVKEIETGNMRVKVGNDDYYLLTIHDGFSAITGGAISTYVLGAKIVDSGLLSKLSR